MRLYKELTSDERTKENVLESYKLCKDCGELRQGNEFGATKRITNYGLQASCKSCRKEYREANKERRKEYYEANKEYLKEYAKKYYKRKVCKI